MNDQRNSVDSFLALDLPKRPGLWNDDRLCARAWMWFRGEA
jgi:hypothetical protein